MYNLTTAYIYLFAVFFCPFNFMPIYLVNIYPRTCLYFVIILEFVFHTTSAQHQTAHKCDKHIEVQQERRI